VIVGPHRSLACLLLIGALVACGRFSTSDTNDPDGGSAPPLDAAVPTPLPDAAAADAADGAVCTGEACNGEPTCRAYPFDVATCGPDWKLNAGSGTTVACAGGKLGITAEGTLDADARLSFDMPVAPLARVRTSMLVSVDAWDGGPMVDLRLDDQSVATIRAIGDASGFFTFAICESRQSVTCVPLAMSVRGGIEHRLSIVAGAAQIQVSLDCVSVAAIRGVPLKSGASIEIVLGKQDATPAIKATFDDLVVRFE
jgi:hypothetical protein